MSWGSSCPAADLEDLRHHYVGRSLHEVEGPAAIIDFAVARRNCDLMLKAAELLDVGFRAHIKSHKTAELTREQVGKSSDTVKLVVSTVAEIEQLLPMLLSCKAELGIFVKLDNGYHRAGLTPDGSQFNQLVTEIHKLECSEGRIKLRGFYSHLGNSYGSDSSDEALEYLAAENEGCALATLTAGELYGHERRFVCSVGATPTATSAQNLLVAENKSPAVVRVNNALSQAKAHHDVELHAGAYVTLDMQQLAAHARTSNLTFDNVALTVLTEIASVYNHREPAPEALIACGKLSLGYDACKSYDGMGVVTPWLDRALHPSSHCDIAASQPSQNVYNPDAERHGWIVHKASQEHGMLRWIGPTNKIRPLQIGEKIRIIPNHCCMCLANFSFVLVIDSDSIGDAIEKERVRDVWLSWGVSEAALTGSLVVALLGA
ncbi:hypothetical protein KEM56_007743 [Ascosphaera pollenicola]|nr:hypothetical protein KEM56_007743 [Ascosphaera pollenicola]